MNFNIFSQNDTAVKLNEPIARLVIKDLIQGDGNTLELRETQKILGLERQKIVLKDSVITNLETKIFNLGTIITNKDNQFSLEREKSLQLEKEIKSEKTKTLLYKIGTYVGAIGIIFLSIQ